jgi:amino acid transporter
MLWASIGEIGLGSELLLMNDADSYLPNGNPGGNVVVATLLFLIITLLQAYIYYRMIPAVGRTGGDYVWMSRNIGAWVPTILIYGFLFTGFPFIAISLNWMFTLALSPSISTIGVVTGNTGLASVASSLTTPVFLAVVSIVIMIVLTVVNILSPARSYWLIAVFAAIGTIGMIIVGLVFVTNGPSGIQASVSAVLQQNNATYTGIASQYTGSGLDFGAIALLFPYLMFALPYFNNTAAFGGELKNIRKSALYGTVLAVVVGGALLMIFLQMYYSYLGFNFAMQAPVSWPSALSNIGVYPNMLTIATIAASGNPALMWIMNIFFAVWYLAAAQQTILADSRYILAMSFDGILPRRLAGVSDRFHTPIVSIVIVFFVTVGMILFSSFTSWLSLFVTSAEGSLWFAFIGVTAIAYSWKKKAELKSAYTWLILSGVIVMIFFLYITYQYLFLPYYGLGWTAPSATLWASLALILGVWIVGAIAYPIAKWYFKKQGLDMNLIFKELPPE